MAFQNHRPLSTLASQKKAIPFKSCLFARFDCIFHMALSLEFYLTQFEIWRPGAGRRSGGKEAGEERLEVIKTSARFETTKIYGRAWAREEPLKLCFLKSWMILDKPVRFKTASSSTSFLGMMTVTPKFSFFRFKSAQ